MYHLIYNVESGKIDGFLDDSRYTIQSNSIQLTDEEYDLYCNNQGEYLVNLETKTVFKRELTRDDLLDRYIRPMRNTLLYSQTDKVSKYLRQKDMVAAGLLTNTDITEAQYLSICKYIQELCDMTDTVDPLNPVWPTKPM